MSYRPSYNMTVEKQDVVLRFKKDIIDQAALSKLLDHLEMESIRKRSQLTEEQAAELAAEINRAVWEGIKSQYAEA